MCLHHVAQVEAHGVAISSAYFGEFGYELQLHVPYVYYMHKHGALNRTVASFGTQPLYYFSRNHTDAWPSQAQTHT